MIFLLLLAFWSSQASAGRNTAPSLRAGYKKPSGPSAPIAVEAAPIETSTGWNISVSWLAGSTDTSAYEIWRWTTDIGWQLLGTTSGFDTEFIDFEEEIELSSNASWEGYTKWAHQPVYRVVASNDWGSATSELAWATNRIPGIRLNKLAIIEAPWNNPYAVAELWGDNPTNEGPSIEEVALTGGTLQPAWTWVPDTIDNAKTTLVAEMTDEARAIAEEADVPLRVIIETRPDQYTESATVARGFDDDWLLKMDRVETCNTLLSMVDQGFTVSFTTTTMNLPAFWVRVWRAPLIEEGGQLLFDPAGCSPTAIERSGPTAPLFYGRVDDEDMTVKINAAITDMTNPDYIEWSTDWAAQFVEDFGADMAFSPVKSGWYAWSTEKDQKILDLSKNNLDADDSWSCNSWRPSRMDDWAMASDNHAPLSACSPFGPDEFEAGMRDWVRRFSVKAPGVPFMTNENPAKGGVEGKLDWTNDEPWLADVIAGDGWFMNPCIVYSQCLVTN